MLMRGTAVVLRCCCFFGDSRWQIIVYLNKCSVSITLQKTRHHVVNFSTGIVLFAHFDENLEENIIEHLAT